MLGIDQLEVDRMQRALERTPSLKARLFTEGEQAYSEAQAVPARSYAARFCAKEAVVKALRLESWDAREIEVVHAASGAPEIVLHGSLAGRGPVAVSITHTRLIAAAVAMLMPPTST